MAETLKIPTEVVDSSWKDDIDLDFETYKNESKYDSKKIDGEQINKNEIKNTSIKTIKKRKIGHIALFSQNDKLAA